MWEVLYKFSLREVLEDCECSGNLMMFLNKQSCVSIALVVVSNPLTLNTSTCFFWWSLQIFIQLHLWPYPKMARRKKENTFWVNLPDEVYSVKIILCGYQVILQVTNGVIFPQFFGFPYHISSDQLTNRLFFWGGIITSHCIYM